MPLTTQIPSAGPSQAETMVDKLKLAEGHAAVVGLQWGDEGKGQTVDVLTSRFDLVVRYNGGANAGHSVYIGQEKFALHLLPSGILNPDKINVVGNGVVLDPAKILEEITGLQQRGVTVGGNLRISDRAHVVFPYHKLEDALLERTISPTSGDERRIGTTGRGIGPCYADKALRSTAIRVGELLDADQFREKLKHVVRVKNLILAALAGDSGEKYEPFDAGRLADEYLGYAQLLRPYICDTTRLLHESIAGGKHILFEGANAVLLDIDHGTYPFVTSSSCSSGGVFTGAGVPGATVSNVIGIVKLYSSRVGGGPFPTELLDETAQTIREAGKEYGTTTGRPRRCGWLDLMAVRYTAAISGATAITCTGLAVLAGLPSLRICVGYRHKGRKLDAFPSDARVLAAAEPIYQEFEGFAGPIDGCSRFDDLSAQAREYVEFVEQFVGVPVRFVCVGRRRDQILVR